LEYIEGIDVSNHQGLIDHQAVANSGMRFCVVKATEGRDYIDKRFAENIAAIREVMSGGSTYFPGAYHFARPDTMGGAEDGKAEGEDFCDAVETACGSIQKDFMPPALDFEKYSESDVQQNIPWIAAWISTVEARLGRTPMIYTGANIWRYEVGNTSQFVAYPLWQTYFSGDAIEPPAMPWPRWSLWQYSGGNNFQHHPPVPGVGVVDIERWHGTLDDLKVFAHSSGITPPLSRTWPRPPPTVDLNVFRGSYSDYVARIQGLLLAQGYGPAGLLNSFGYPDGLMGSKTQSYLVDFKVKHALAADAVVDWSTWWALAYDKLGG
jgi:lysozyme